MFCDQNNLRIKGKFKDWAIIFEQINCYSARREPTPDFSWLCRGLMRMRHGVPEIEMNDDHNFSAMTHSDKQISRQISTIVFSNTLLEALLMKLVDSAFYMLFRCYRKTERIQLLAPCYFQTQQAL